MLQEILTNVVPIVIGVIVLVVFISMSYIKAPPNKAAIISGFRKVPRH